MWYPEHPFSILVREVLSLAIITLGIFLVLPTDDVEELLLPHIFAQLECHDGWYVELRVDRCFLKLPVEVVISQRHTELDLEGLEIDERQIDALVRSQEFDFPEQLVDDLERSQVRDFLPRHLHQFVVVGLANVALAGILWQPVSIL